MNSLSLPARLRAAVRRTFRVLPWRERVLILACILAASGGAAWGISLLVRAMTVAIPAQGGTLIEGAVGQPRFVLPILAQTSDTDMDLSRLVYSGLFAVGADGTLTPDLATTMTASEDGKTYTVELRDGVRWHDGEPFTSEDVLLTMRLIRDPAVKSPLAPSFEGIRVEKVSDRAVRFALDEPYAPFPYSLTVGILPSHLWADVPPQSVALSERILRPVGTGPFQFEKLKKAAFSGEIHEYRLVRNERYHGPAPLLDGVTFKFFSSTDDLVRALRRSEVGGVSLLPPSLVQEAARARAVRIQRLGLPQYFAVFFNQAKSPPLSDLAVRRALAGATDRERMIREALHGEASAVAAALPPGSAGTEPDLPTIPFDVERARQNLEEAGWKDADGNGMREKDGVPLAFSLVTSDWPEYVTSAKLLAEQWRAIGADVSVQPATPGAMQADILRPRNYQALLYGEVLGADPDLYAFWHSTQTRDPGLNLSLFKDRESDQLLEEARKITDREARGRLYRKFQERLIQEVPAIFLYSPLYLYAVPKKLGGTFLERAPLPADRFALVSSWHLKTRRVRKGK